MLQPSATIPQMEACACTLLPPQQLKPLQATTMQPARLRQASTSRIRASLRGLHSGSTGARLHREPGSHASVLWNAGQRHRHTPHRRPARQLAVLHSNLQHLSHTCPTQLCGVQAGWARLTAQPGHMLLSGSVLLGGLCWSVLASRGTPG